MLKHSFFVSTDKNTEWRWPITWIPGEFYLSALELLVFNSNDSRDRGSVAFRSGRVLMIHRSPSHDCRLFLLANAATAQHVTPLATSYSYITDVSCDRPLAGIFSFGFKNTLINIKAVNFKERLAAPKSITWLLLKRRTASWRCLTFLLSSGCTFPPGGSFHK